MTTAVEAPSKPYSINQPTANDWEANRLDFPQSWSLVWTFSMIRVFIRMIESIGVEATGGEDSLHRVVMQAIRLSTRIYQ